MWISYQYYRNEARKRLTASLKTASFKLIFLFLVVPCLPVFSTEMFSARGIIEFDRLTDASARRELKFTLHVDGRNWSIRTSPTGKDERNSSKLYNHMTFDGANLYHISVINTNLSSSDWTKKNLRALEKRLEIARSEAEKEAILKQFPKGRLTITNRFTAEAHGQILNNSIPKFAPDLIAPLWIAYASSAYFELAENKVRLPRSLFTLEKEGSESDWYAVDYEHIGHSGNLPVGLKVYRDETKTNAVGYRFTVVDRDLVDNQFLPKSSALIAFFPGSGETNYVITMTVEEASSGVALVEEAYKPDIPVDTYVADLRFGNDLGDRPVSYVLRSGSDWPSSTKVRESGAFDRALITEQNSSKEGRNYGNRLVFFVIMVGLGLTFLYFGRSKRNITSLNSH